MEKESRSSRLRRCLPCGANLQRVACSWGQTTRMMRMMKTMSTSLACQVGSYGRSAGPDARIDRT